MIYVSFVIIFALTSICHARNLDEAELDSYEIWPVLCAPDTYFNLKQQECVSCLECPVNKIITTPCQGFHNTKCSPLYDFKEFLLADPPSHPSDNNEKQLTSGTKNYQKTSNPDSHNKFIDDHNQATKTHDQDLKHGAPYLDKTSKDALELTASERLSLTISILVCISILVIFIFVVGVCLFQRKMSSQKKLVCQYSSPPESV